MPGMSITLGIEPQDIAFEDFEDKNLLRLCIGAVAEYEDLRTWQEVLPIYRELKDDGGPTFISNALEFDVGGQEYTMMTYDDAKAFAEEMIQDYATEQANELDNQLKLMGIVTTYVTFDYDMFTQDCGYDWEQFLNSYDGTSCEYFPLSTNTDTKLLHTQGSYLIWRS